MPALGPALILVSIPLLFRWIPRNGLYGFRMRATLRHDAVWYDVNARSARHFILLGTTLVVLELALPPSFRNGSLAAVGVVGVAAVTIVNWRYANRLARQLESDRRSACRRRLRANAESPERVAASYLMPTTIESGPTSGSTRVSENPAALIQPAQSAPV